MEAVKEVFPLVRCVGQEGELDDIAFEGEGAKATAESLRRELSGEVTDILSEWFYFCPIRRDILR
eukprot:33357-Amorphochlora_amoeboformis.AAC.1